MKKRATKKPKVSPKAKKQVALRRALKTAKSAVDLGAAPLVAAKKAITWRDARTRVEAALAPPPPVTSAPPTYSAPWRKSIDWVAAGKKAYETRMRNLALKAGGTPATPAQNPPPMAAPIARARKPKAPSAPATALTEADTSRS